MSENDHLIESCQHLLDLSAALHERSEQVEASSVEQAARLALLDQRYRDAVAEAQRLQRRPTTFWRLYDR